MVKFASGEYKDNRETFVDMRQWYGELQGLNKQETADRYGKEQVHVWRRSYDIPPPNGESLEMCAERAVAYFKDHNLARYRQKLDEMLH
ncbi:hypothetical protein QYF36_023974 [Acer negundo]|nr:hypothetical protein QYF36_023974 [Acer negundo]